MAHCLVSSGSWHTDVRQSGAHAHRRCSTCCSITRAHQRNVGPKRSPLQGAPTQHCLLIRNTATTLRPRARHSSQLTAAATCFATTAAFESSFASIFAVFLGYCTMAGALFRSVPQIIKVWQNKSVQGLSVTTFVAELVCYTITTAYNWKQEYAFNTYGEVVACVVQDLILMAMIFTYNRSNLWTVALSSFSFVLLTIWLFSPACSMSVLSFLQLSTLVVLPLFGRIPQIILNWKRGDAGMLSAATCLLNVVGSAVRIYTTAVLTQDMLMLATAAVGGFLHGVLLVQCIQTDLAKRAKQQDGPGGNGMGSAIPAAA